MEMATTSTNCADALPSKTSLKLAELRSRVLIGELPADFLRIVPSADQSAGVTMQPQQPIIVAQQPYVPATVNPAEHFYSFVPPHTRGRIAVKIVEAKLTKNYGLPGVRMDPYVRLRIGNTLFETPTCVNGGKTPHWNRTVNAYLPDGVESIYLQIYDERSFTDDECVAWAHIILPPGIFNQETIDEWYQLSGPQGEGKEGVVNLVISFSPVARPRGAQADQQQAEQARVGTPVPLFTEGELNEMAEMFPNIDKEVVRSVLEEKRGDKESAVNALIEMEN